MTTWRHTHSAGTRGRPTPQRTTSRSSALAMSAVLLSIAPQAQAYLDPGTGSILLQGLIAAVAAVVAYAGMYWQKVKSFFSRRPRADASEPERPDPAAERNPDSDG